MFSTLFRRTLALIRDREIVVVDSQSLPFGGWSITIAGDPRLRITMDGRDNCLFIDADLKAQQQAAPWMRLWSPETGATATAEQIVEHLQALGRRDLGADAALWAAQIAAVIDDK